MLVVLAVPGRSGDYLKKTPCPKTQGFWKTHPDAWPVDELYLGGIWYSPGELLELLRTPPKGDASMILAHQLIAAELNVANGANMPVYFDV